MQLFGLHRNIYKLAHYACKQENREKIEKIRLKFLKDWEYLKQKGLKDKEIEPIVGMSRSTYYRYKKAIKTFGFQALEKHSKRPHRVRKSLIPDTVKKRILILRQENPTYGKKKITAILKREHIFLSESSVGRVLSHFREKGWITTYQAARKVRKKRTFHGHAKPWRSDLKAKQAGEMIQLDHMSVCKNQMNFKHFQAWDPVTKVIVAECYTQATSATAAKFLDKLLKELPFKVLSIQVDGGSEFMKDFEKACAEKQIPLYVLPPKSPKLNGGVERANRTFREDLYAKRLLANSINEMRDELKKAVSKYNTFRPHEHLGGKTPFEYTSQILKVAA